MVIIFQAVIKLYIRTREQMGNFFKSGGKTACKVKTNISDDLFIRTRLRVRLKDENTRCLASQRSKSQELP